MRERVSRVVLTHKQALEAQTVSQMVDAVLALEAGSKLMLLAPVVRNRKGEYAKLFDELSAQGFLRARINGTVYELDQTPTLELRKKHTIEVVVDRFKVREDLALRLSESFETALRIADGLASVAWMDDEGQDDLLFSANYACPHCGYSLPELEPRLFSFNSPSGACPTCDGLGVHQAFDESRVVSKPELSLAEGAVRGWDRRNAYYFHLIDSLAAAYDFDVDVPYKDLPANVRKVLMHGSGRKAIEFRYVGQKGQVYQKTHPFEGILNNLDRRYRDTDSNSVREELMKYLSTRSCPTCEGARLNEAARNVFIDDKDLSQITEWAIGDTLQVFRRY